MGLSIWTWPPAPNVNTLILAGYQLLPAICSLQELVGLFRVLTERYEPGSLLIYRVLYPGLFTPGGAESHLRA